MVSVGLSPFLPSPALPMEEGRSSARCLPSRCQGHSFPSLLDGTYLQPLQQGVTTAEHPTGSRAGASPPAAHLTTLSAPLGSQTHQNPSSSSDAAGKQAVKTKTWRLPLASPELSPGRRCPRRWDLWLQLPSEHISLQHAQPTARPLPALIKRSLTFIFGDSRLLLLHLCIKGRSSPPWESSEVLTGGRGSTTTPASRNPLPLQPVSGSRPRSAPSLLCCSAQGMRHGWNSGAAGRFASPLL